MVGVDRNPNVPLEAGYDNVVAADVENGLPAELGRTQQFDRILLLDVLEHLRDPRKLLQDSKNLLAPRGRMIVSVPNAVNLTVRWMLLFGRFRYSDRGILDWSHLRFFTARSIRGLVESEGYYVSSRHFTVVPIERVIPLRSDSRLLRFANHLLRGLTALAPGLFAYEIVLVADRQIER